MQRIANPRPARGHQVQFLVRAYFFKMAEVKVIIEGTHNPLGGEKLKVNATVTLIKSDKNILVDTGYFNEREIIISKLKEENLTHESIDIVILTHTHLDHIVNTYLFPNAKIFCKLRKNYSGQFHIPSEGCLERFDLKDGVELAKDVSILLTPGHTEDHISVVVKTNKGIVVIAGDALASESLMDINKQPLLAADFNDFNESRKKILKIADYIVPGHGNIFQVKK